MDKRTRNILLIGTGAIILAAWYANKENETKKVSTIPQAKPQLPTETIDKIEELKETQESDALSSASPVTEIPAIEFGQYDPIVSVMKKSLQFITRIQLDTTDVYDKDLLIVVQAFLKDSPALFDFNTGKVCINFITNLDYILSKRHSENKPTFTIPEMNRECEWIKKGEKGKEVMKMEEVLYFLDGRPDDKLTALYTKKLSEFTDKMLSGTNIYDNSNNEAKVCKMWINAMSVMINNIKNWKNV